MKILLMFYSSLLFFQGCSVDLGRGSSNFELNNADGRYIMTALIDITKGRAVPVTLAPEKHQVQIRWIPTNSVNNYDSSFLDKWYFFRFHFYGLDGKQTSSLEAAPASVDFNDKYHQERQWLTINDSTGLLVVLERDIGRGVTTRLMISNVMKSSAYKSELDTIRYIYRPKFN